MRSARSKCSGGRSTGRRWDDWVGTRSDSSSPLMAMIPCSGVLIARRSAARTRRPPTVGAFATAVWPGGKCRCRRQPSKSSTRRDLPPGRVGARTSAWCAGRPDMSGPSNGRVCAPAARRACSSGARHERSTSTATACLPRQRHGPASGDAGSWSASVGRTIVFRRCAPPTTADGQRRAGRPRCRSSGGVPMRRRWTSTGG